MVNGMKIKKIAVAIGFSVFLVTSTPVYATGVPTIDFAGLVEKITANITEMTNWAQEKAKMALQMDMESLLSKLEISNMNNAFSNMIARSGAALQNIQNMEVAEMMAVDKDVCGNVAFSLFDEQVSCYVDDRANAETHDIVTDVGRYDLGPVQFDKHYENVTNKIIDKCESLLTVDEYDLEEGEKVMYSQCLQAGSMLGIGTSNTFTETEEDAVEMQIRLITGPFPEQKHSTDLVVGSDGWVRTRLKEMRKDAFKSIPVATFNEIAKWRKKASDGAPLSRMEVLQEFVDARKDPNWILQVAGAKWDGVDGGGDTTVYRTELLKKMTVLELKQTELQLEQFKHQLRLEGINAAMLALMLDPVK